MVYRLIDCNNSTKAMTKMMITKNDDINLDYFKDKSILKEK